MFLLSVIEGLRVGDMIAQLVFFVILIALIVGIISLVVMFIKRNKRLDKIEEKLDQLVKDKEE